MNKDENVPISFFDIMADNEWEPLELSADDPNFYWNDGGFMTSAPVDIAATFKGAMSAAVHVEPAFKWRGRRIRPGFTVPRRHHNVPQVMIVVGGRMDIGYGKSGEETQSVGPGEFWTAEAATPYTMTSGPEGVTYLESWTEPVSLIETYWHDDKNWKRR